MSQSPNQSQKQKKKQKKNKQRALKDFLEVQKVDSTITAPSDMAPSDLASANLSEHEQKVERVQQKSCTICEAELGDKKRNWYAFMIFVVGFVALFFVANICARKGKINKLTSLLESVIIVKIDIQVKNQQSIAVQQSIVEAAKEEIETKVMEKRKIMKKHQSKCEQITNKRKQHQKKWQQQQNQLNFKNQQIDSKNRDLDNLEQNLKQMEAKMPPDLAEDYKTLEIRSQKVIKQIAKYEKLVTEASAAKAKKERQMYEEYNKWENKQKVKLAQKPQDCCIF